MSNTKKWLINGTIATAGILGSLFYFNKNKSPKVKTIPEFFSGQAPYLFAHRGMAVRPEQTISI